MNGRTLVPIRPVFEAIGFRVAWDGTTNTAAMSNSQYVVNMQINNKTLHTSGWNDEMDVPPQIINGRTMVPIRTPMERIGYDVEWISETQTVKITRNIVREIETELFYKINQHRAMNNAPALIWHEVWLLPRVHIYLTLQ